MKDMKRYRKLPAFMHKNKQFFDMYPSLLGKAAQEWFRVDGVDKGTKEKQILQAFRSRRSLTGLIGDAFKFARAMR
jgi:electron transfer flavoprotein-quinone oxidoreductase